MSRRESLFIAGCALLALLLWVPFILGGKP